MSESDNTLGKNWASSLELLSKKLRANAKAITASDDPFVHREQINRAAEALEEMGGTLMSGLPDLRRLIEKECIEASAEFWQRFSSAANDAGWEVCGSTERRLVARAFIVELKNETVSIDGITGRYTPNVTKLIQILEPHISGLSANYGSLQQFADMLAQAYDWLGGSGDVAIETVFRQCVFLMQPATFWSSMERAKFKEFPRPAFRYLLSALLAENTKTADGREVRLTPTVNRKDVWELFLPAEGHVVQVGRIALLKR